MKKGRLWLLLVVVMLIAVFVSLNSGQIKISVLETIDIIGTQINPALSLDTGYTQEQKAVLWHIRMPRTIVALLVGGALAVSGATMQAIFGNPLADPGIIGVSSGAAAGAVVAIALGYAGANIYAMPVFAFCGSLGATMLVVSLAMTKGEVPTVKLLLSGVAVGIFLGAMTSGILLFMNEQKLQQFLFWTVGGLDYRRWEHVQIALGPIVVGTGIICLLARHLNILVLGTTEAKAVGMPVNFYRIVLLIIASFITATAVCVSGNIGFVGLVIPHMMRMLVGPDCKVLLPISVFAGGIFLVLCDTLGRLIIQPAELRVGIVTAIVGTPYFLYLLKKMRY